MDNKYDVNYFIDKFSKIPEDKWISHVYGDGQGRFCALGHCKGWDGYFFNDNVETLNLSKLFAQNLGMGVTNVNDGLVEAYLQKTERERILTALKDIKKKLEPENPVRTIIKYVAVDAIIRTKAQSLVETN